MKTLTVSNHKGGCGKTTTAVNIAAGLALKGHRTLLIDLDPQGAATVGLGLDKSTLGLQMTDVFLERAQLAEVIRPCACSNLSVAPSNLNLASAEAHLAGQPGKEFVIKEQIGALAGKGLSFEYIVMDTPPNLGTLTLNGLVGSDLVLIPIQCEYYALEGVGQLEAILTLIQQRFGRNPGVRALLTMYDTRLSLAKEVAQLARDHFGDSLISIPIPRNVKLAEAPAQGKSVFEYAPTSAGAQAYLTVIDEVIA